MLVGYARVLTVEQDPEYQIRALEARGCGRIYTDHCPSRSKTRPSVFHDSATVPVAQALLRDNSVSRVEAARRLVTRKTTLRRWFPRYEPDEFWGRNGGRA